MFPMMNDASKEEQQTIEVLHEQEGWPADYGKDLQLVRRLAGLYPTIDLYEEAVKWTTWMTEHESKRKVKFRARFANWCKKAEEFKSAKSRRSGRTHRRAEQEGHGDSVEVARGW